MTNIIHKICNWYFSHRALPYWCILVMDCMVVYISGLIVYYIRHGGMGLVQHLGAVNLGLCICLLVYIVAFMVFHTFHGVMRYSSFIDLHRVAYSTAAAGIGVCFLHQVQVYAGLTRYILIPRFESAILLFIVATMISGGSVFSLRVCMIFIIVVMIPSRKFLFTVVCKVA